MVLVAALSAWLLAANPFVGADAHPGDWLEIVTGGADSEARLPLVIALHGRGQRPERLAAMLSVLKVRARVIVPRAPRHGRTWFAPGARSRDRAGLSRALLVASRQAAGLVDTLAARYPTCGSTTMVGVSQGGMMALAIAGEQSHAIGHVVSIASWVPRDLWPAASVQVTALHGTEDHRVPYRWTRRMIRAMRAEGRSARLVSHRGVGHATPALVRRGARRAVARAVRQQWVDGCSE